MLAQQESTNDKPWTGAHKSFGVWTVFFIHRLRDFGSHRPHPVRLEIFSPFWELSEAAYIVQHDLKFPVIRWCQFRDQHPRKEV